jgi:hypothetical protein
MAPTPTDPLPWWEGERWIGAISPDGRWRFNGSRWVPHVPRSRPPLSGSLQVWRVIWLLVWGAWFPISAVVLLVVDPSPNDMATAVWILAVPAGVGLTATLSWGFALGLRRLWRQLGLSIVLGTAVLMAGYVLAFMISDASDPQPGGDDAAGAGLVILSVPVAITVAATLALGAATARLGQVLGQRLRA